MAPGQVLFDQAGLGRGKVGGRGLEKSAAVRGLERGTSFGEVRAPYLQAMPMGFDVRKSSVKSISQRRAETQQHGLEMDSFKPRLEIGIFQCIFWLNDLIFGGDGRVF
jgi:hypothetical protein